MSVVYLAKNQVYHTRTKHIDVRYHFVREILENGDIELKKINPRIVWQICLRRLFTESSSIIARTCSESFQWLELGGAHLDELRETIP